MVFDNFIERSSRYKRGLPCEALRVRKSLRLSCKQCKHPYSHYSLHYSSIFSQLCICGKIKKICLAPILSFLVEKKITCVNGQGTGLVKFALKSTSSSNTGAASAHFFRLRHHVCNFNTNFFFSFRT